PLTLGTPDGIEADAALTAEPGVAPTIMVADCLPLLFASEDGRTVAAAHAGWRGLSGANGVGVLEDLWRQLQPRIADDPLAAASRVLAWLGPCIGPEAFEVGPEVQAAFEAGDARAACCFKPYRAGKWLADLQGLARLRLSALGITRIYGNDGSTAWSTVANPSRFFSHRRDRTSGRFAASIWRT